MKAFFQSARGEWILHGGLIFLAAALAYLPLAGQLGFYRDDWHVVWGAATQGVQKIIDLHVIDRPFMGVTYAAAYAMLGSSPLAWHLYAFFLRVAGGFAAYWIFRQIFGARTAWAGIAAVLFVVYPGFLQQPTANAYHNHLFGLFLGLMSLGCSLRAMRVKTIAVRILLVAAGVFSGLGCFVIMEYMVGFEGVRVLLLLFALQQAAQLAWRRQLKRLALWELPYLVGMLVFLTWRIFFFKSARSVTDVGSLAQMYRAQPVEMALRVGIESLKDLVEAVVMAWVVPFYRATAGAAVGDWLVSLLLGVSVGIFAFLLIFARKDTLADSVSGRSWKQIAGLGVASALLVILPVILSNRDIRFEDTFDRYTLPASFGAVLLLVAGLSRLNSHRIRASLLGIILCTSVMVHYHNAVFFRNFWSYQQQLWWQLTWRAPAFAPDTLLLPHLPGVYSLSESYEVWGPANMIYAPDGSLPVVGEVLNAETIQHLINGSSLKRTVRRVAFTQDFKHALVLSIPDGNSCLHALDKDWMELSANESPIVRLAARYSQIDRIRDAAGSPNPPSLIFGSEPEHGWCYYYQKGSLARQLQNWQEAARLGDEAIQANLKPKNVMEWFPFYQGYAMTARFDEANALANEMRGDLSFLRSFCSQFPPERMQTYRQGSTEEFIILNLCEARY